MIIGALMPWTLYSFGTRAMSCVKELNPEGVPPLRILQKRFSNQANRAFLMANLLDAYFREVAFKSRRFVALDFAVLRGGSSEVVVELDGFVSSDACFIGRRVGSEPEMDVVFWVGF